MGGSTAGNNFYNQSPGYGKNAVTQNSSSTFDAKKVADIKAALANGTFQIDLDKVADGLFATVKDLISTRNS